MLGAGISDPAGARRVLAELSWDKVPELLTVWADGAYQGSLQRWAAQEMGFFVEVVPKPEGQKGFCVLPKRWIVERTFAWLMRYRRLRSDYETNPGSSVAWIYTAMIHLMARRLAA